MSAPFLCGFLDGYQVVPDSLRQQDRCRFVDWDEVDSAASADGPWQMLERLEDWTPEFFLLRLGLAPLPPWIWTIPLPIVAVVEDLDMLWHHHLLCLPYCALTLADPASAASLLQTGFADVRELEGLEKGLGFGIEDDEVMDTEPSTGIGLPPSDTDVLVIGLPHPTLDRDGLARMRPWARLGERYRVLCTQARGNELASQISQARLLIVRSGDRDRAWIERRSREAGIPCLVEEQTDGTIVSGLLDQKDGTSLCWPRRVPERLGKTGKPSASVWNQLLSIIDAEWETIRRNAANEGKCTAANSSLLLARCQHLLAAGPRGDSSLIGDLSRRLARKPDNPALHSAMGLATVGYGHSKGQVSAAEVSSALEEFRRAIALDPNQPVVRLNMVEALALLGQKEGAAVERGRPWRFWIGRGMNPSSWKTPLIYRL